MAGDAVPKYQALPPTECFRQCSPATGRLSPHQEQIARPAALVESISEQLDIINIAFRVIEMVRPKLACNRCDCIVQAPLPPKPFERSYASPGLLAHIIMAKFAKHVRREVACVIVSQEQS